MPSRIAGYTQRRILAFFLPLAASWLLMGAEGPILQAAIARLKDMQVQLAAFGIVLSLEIAIESPVIMLLATSTALATSARNYLVLRRFVVLLIFFVTIVAILMAFSPLYDLVVRVLMGIPQDIAAAARPGMKIMILWSASIGFRRFKQGVLIHRRETKWIGYGTILRLVASGGTGIALAVLSDLPGVYIASIGLMAGVIGEAFFVALAARPTVKALLEKRQTGGPEFLSLRDVLRFHSPLAVTSLLTLLAQPIIGAGLARMPHPEENLAAWPVIWGILFIFRSPSLALPEAVISLLADPRLKGSLRRFAYAVGVFSTIALILTIATPLLGFYLRYVAGLPEHLSRFVTPGLLLALAVPFSNSVHSWFRGLLMAARRTRVIYVGMGLNLALTGLVVFTGVALQTPGSPTAVVALTFSFWIEIYYLRRLLQRAAPGSR